MGTIIGGPGAAIAGTSVPVVGTGPAVVGIARPLSPGLNYGERYEILYSNRHIGISYIELF